MTDREFLHQFRRGIGSAIVELQDNEQRERFKEIVLRCCLKDIGYDIQSEGTKGDYLYQAISTLGCEDEFLARVPDVYLRRLPHGLMVQITDLLTACERNGSNRAFDILRMKHKQLWLRLKTQKTFPTRYCEREQFETLQIAFLYRGGWKSFENAIHNAGAIILKRGEDLCSEYDWFFACAEDRFDEQRVQTYLHTAGETSPRVRAMRDAYEASRALAEERDKKRVQSPITADLLISDIQNSSSDDKPYRVIGKILRFGREASKAELVLLAERIKSEEDPAVLARLLRVYQDVDYPLDPAFLLELARSNHAELREAAVQALGRFREKSIHDLAVSLIEENEADLALTLLQKNWRKADDALIESIVLKSRRVTHAMQMNLLELYLKHRSCSCGKILLHTYRNGECGFCRRWVIDAMAKNKILTDEILRECQYDSYDETRAFADRLLKRRAKANCQ